jgi:Flp pilus assembly protein TadG
MRDDAGAQMVEFALVLPVLLLMVLGILNAGHLFGQKLALNQAVREGARMAAVPGTNNGASVDSVGEIQALVRTNTGGLVDATRVNVTLSASTGCRNLTVGQQLRVTAAYDAPPLVPMPIPGFPASFGLTGTAVYRCEWGQ